jgi:hypothetical protein
VGVRLGPRPRIHAADGRSQKCAVTFKKVIDLLARRGDVGSRFQLAADVLDRVGNLKVRDPEFVPHVFHVLSEQRECLDRRDGIA